MLPGTTSLPVSDAAVREPGPALHLDPPRGGQHSLLLYWSSRLLGSTKPKYTPPKSTKAPSLGKNSPSV